MADDLRPEDDGSFIARLLQDPVGLRRWSRRVALFLIVLVAISSDGLGGRVPSMVFPLTWLALPFVALGIGYGDAFFIRYGRGVRLELVMLAGGAIVALSTCVLLSVVTGADGESGLERLVDAALYGLLYGGILALLAALVGFGLGRGLDYAGRRIESMSEEEW